MLISFDLASLGNNILDSVIDGVYPFLSGSRGPYPYSDGRHLIMAVTSLYVYADESGMHESPAYVILAGYIGSVRAWSSFKRRWKQTLDREEISEFHAHEFFSRNRGSHTNQFEGWSDERAFTFLEALASIIVSEPLHGIGAAIDAPAFLNFSKGDRRYLTDAIIKTTGKWRTSGAPSQPWLLAFHWLVQEALGMAKDGTEVHLVFDTQDQLEGVARQRFDEIITSRKWPGNEKLRSISFKDRRREPELQAVDLRAYLWNLAIEKGNTLEGRLAEIMSTLEQKKTLAFFDARTLNELLDPINRKQRQIRQREL